MNPIEESHKPGGVVCACNASTRVMKERSASTSYQAGAHVSEKVRLEKLSNEIQSNFLTRKTINKVDLTTMEVVYFTELNS